ncbi:hypothetical protein C5167_018106 [Papaver somniferum]|uniref:Uncharacterized protein n=1 Tax=Papaver somniferum TaxID=3469 RepID=A0A4Y7IQD4_PAPSO|nr:hypothetical protein C5167_018106 [Papaver somniferum]
MSTDKVELEVTLQWGHDYNNVLTGAPWNVDGYLMVLKEWHPTNDPRNIDFSIQQYWLDIKKLPPEFLNAEVVHQIGSIAGNVLKLEPEDGNPVDTNHKASHVQTIDGYIFKFGEDYGEVIDPRANNPVYGILLQKRI